MGSRHLLASLLVACHFVLAGCGEKPKPEVLDEQAESPEDQSLESNESDKVTASEGDPSQVEQGPAESIEPPPGPKPIRLTRSDLEQAEQLLLVADQCLSRKPSDFAPWGTEMTALAITHRYMGDLESYERVLEQAFTHIGNSTYGLRTALDLLGRTKCFETIERVRENAEDPELKSWAAYALLNNLDDADAVDSQALLDWCWADAREKTSDGLCLVVATSQIRLGQIDDALKRLEASDGKKYLNRYEVVQAIALQAGEPDRALPLLDLLNNKRLSQLDMARGYLVHAYVKMRESAKAEEQIKMIEGAPYRATARLVRHRVERSAGRVPTEAGEQLAIELLSVLESERDAPRDQSHYERFILENMLLEELLIYGRDDLAKPIFEKRGVFGEEKGDSSSLQQAIGLYLRNDQPVIARQLFQRMDTVGPRHLYLFYSFASDPIVTEQDLINIRPYLDEVFTETENREFSDSSSLRAVSFVIHRSGLSNHEQWGSFVESLRHEMDIMAVCLGTLESHLDLPGPVLFPLPYSNYPLPNR